MSREEKLALFHEEWDWWLNPRKTIRDLKEKLARENALAVRNDAVACEEMAKAAAWKCVAEKLAAALKDPTPTIRGDSYYWQHKQNRETALKEFAALSSENA